jgi:hypothetical protein
MKIIIAVSAFILSSCATSFESVSGCQQQVSALAVSEMASKRKSDEAMAASEKNPESSSLAMDAAQAALEWAVATVDLDEAKRSCVSK